jgi:hypothetical protein
MPIIMHAVMPIKPEAREMFLAAVPTLTYYEAGDAQTLKLG